VTAKVGKVFLELKSTDASLSTVALETGFTSHSHFSTDFRATTGGAPKGLSACEQRGARVRPGALCAV
jgi:transcriptional regulator GlxA family with amidase domain